MMTKLRDRQLPQAVSKRSLLAAMIALTACGCATIRTASNTEPGSPKIYSGTRLDSAALSYDRDTLETYWRHGIYEPAYPAADLAPSFICDTVLLPFTILYVLVNPGTWGR